MALPLANTATGGGSEVTVTTGNSGGTSGNAWNTVTIGTSATLKYDTSTYVGPSGASYRFETAGTSATSLLVWTSTSVTAHSRSYGRAYFALTSFTNTPSLVRARNGTTQKFRISASSAGLIQLRNQANTVVATGSVTMSALTWYRVEWDVTSGTSNNGQLKLFLGNALTPLETISASSADFNASDFNAFNFGIVQATVNHPAMWMDDFAVNSTGYPGPSYVGGNATDTLGMADSVAHLFSKMRFVDDTLTLADAPAKALAYQRAVADGLALADTPYTGRVYIMQTIHAQNDDQATVTTASFTPPANSLMVAKISCSAGSGDNGQDIAISDSLGTITWTEQVARTRSDDPLEDVKPPPIKMWTATGTGQAMTVTGTPTEAGGPWHVTIWILGGAVDLADPVIDTDEISGESTAFTMSTTGGVLQLLGYIDWNHMAAPTGTAGVITDQTVAPGIGGDANRMWSAHRWVTGAGAENIGMTAPTSGNAFNAVVVAIRATEAGGGTEYPRTATDALGMADAITRALATPRAVADAAGLADSTAAQLVTAQAVGETLAAADAVTSTIAAGRTVSDSLGQSDAVARSMVLAGPSSDTLSAADSTTATLVTTQEVGDGIGLADTVIAAVTSARDIAETLGLGDAVTATIAAARAPGDTLELADTLSHALVLAGTAEDGLQASDEVTSSAGAGRETSDTLELAGSTTMQVAVTAFVNDTLDLADSISGQTVSGRETGDTLDLADDPQWIGGQARDVADSLAFDDAPVWVWSFGREVADTLAAEDTVAGQVAAGREVGDSLDAADGTERSGDIGRDVFETLGFTDVLTLGAAAWVRPVADSIRAADTLTRLIIFVRPVADTLTAADAGVAGGGIIRTSTGSITLADAAGPAVIFGRAVGDALAASDVASGLAGKAGFAQDTLTLADAVVWVPALVREVAELLGLADTTGRAIAVAAALADALLLADAAEGEAYLPPPVIYASPHSITMTGLLASVAASGPRAATVNNTSTPAGVNNTSTPATIAATIMPGGVRRTV